MSLRTTTFLTLCTWLSSLTINGLPLRRPLSVQLTEAEMRRNPESWMLDFQSTLKWDYSHGLELGAMLDVAESYRRRDIADYVQAYADTFVRSDGSIRTYRLDEYSLDRINTGKLLFRVYRQTKEQRYLSALQLLRSQLDTHPRNADGGFWHKKVYPHQVWLDGVYMATPFLAEYTYRYVAPVDSAEAQRAYDDVVLQILQAARHTYDPQTGLYRHACDVSRQMFWCDSVSGQSAECWGRALGWYMMAVVDALDFIPQQTAGRDSVLQVLQTIADGLDRWKDPETGLWYQVLDKHRHIPLHYDQPRNPYADNYLESSCSAMFIYSLLKACRQGYLSKRYRKLATRAYNNYIRQFVYKDVDGQLCIRNACAVAGLGGANHRPGTFDYYVHESRRANDPKAVGPFIKASLLMEGR